MIALFNVVSGGAITGALSAALGSQVLGGAVFGLIASGGNPMGAVLGGLSGAIGGVNTSGVDAVSETAKMASENVGNLDVSSGADAASAGSSTGDFARADRLLGNDPGTGSTTGDFARLDRSMPNGSSGGTEMASANTSTVDTGIKAGAGKTSITDTSSDKGAIGKRMGGVETFAKDNPTLARMGMGALQGVGDLKKQETLLEYKKRMQLDYDNQTEQRAYGGMDTSLPWRPSDAGPIGANMKKEPANA